MTNNTPCGIVISPTDISVNDISTNDMGVEMGITNTSALTEAAFYILLSLQTPSHGYAIMQNIKTITNGRICMGAGTLYGALSALNGKGLIAECESNDPARREYVITKAGKTAVEKEIHRLEEMLNNAQKYYKEGR